MLSKEKINELEILSTKIRIEAMKQFTHLGFGHVGGAMSVVELLSVLYGETMNIDPKNPNWEERDWLVVSKGHSGPSVYAALALKGYFSTEELITLNTPGTNLPSHCDRNKTTGVDMTTGSLGQGMSTAIGVALGNKIDAKKSYTYLILGDGECDEGQVWEGALFAAHHKVNNLIGFIDYNKQQLDGYTKDICDLGDLARKFEEFGWYTQNMEGHCIEEIYEAIKKAKKQKEKPSMIVLNTQKGKGCGFAEGILFNHHITVSKEQGEQVITELKNKLSTLEAERGIC